MAGEHLGSHSVKYPKDEGGIGKLSKDFSNEIWVCSNNLVFVCVFVFFFFFCQNFSLTPNITTKSGLGTEQGSSGL